MNDPHAREATLFRFVKSCPGANTEIRITGISVKVKKNRISRQEVFRRALAEESCFGKDSMADVFL